MKNLRNGAWRPYALTIVFLASYALAARGFSELLEPIAALKVEMPELLSATASFSDFLGSLPIGMVMFSLAFALAIGEKFAWWTGFMFSTIFALPLLFVCRTFTMWANGSLVVVGATPLSAPALSPCLILSCCALIPPLAFLALRRGFWRAQEPLSQTSRA